MPFVESKTLCGSEGSIPKLALADTCTTDLLGTCSDPTANNHANYKRHPGSLTCGIASIPTEVFWLIIRHYVTLANRRAKYAHNLRSVCRWWDTAITNCPGIWSEIRGSEIKSTEALRRALKYSRDGPLDIYIRDGPADGQDRLTLVMCPELISQRHRWRQLDIDFEGPTALALVADALSGPAPSLEKAWIRNREMFVPRVEPVNLFGGGAPVLRDLILEGFFILAESRILSGLHSLKLCLGQIFESAEVKNRVLVDISKVLQGCPQLQELTLGYAGRWPSAQFDVPTLEFHNLERLDLTVGDYFLGNPANEQHNSLLPILRRILAPACRNLHIHIPIRTLSELQVIEHLVTGAIRNLAEQDYELQIDMFSARVEIVLLSALVENVVDLHLRGEGGYDIHDGLFHILKHLHFEFDIRWPVFIELHYPDEDRLLSLTSFLDARIITRHGKDYLEDVPLKTLFELDLVDCDGQKEVEAFKKHVRSTNRFAQWTLEEVGRDLIVRQSDQLVVWEAV